MSLKNKSIIATIIFLAFLAGMFVTTYEIYPYSEIKSFYIEENRNYDLASVFENDVNSLIHVHDQTKKIETKKELITFLWKQNDFPTSQPTKIENNIIDERYSNLQNLDSIDRLTIEMENDINSIAYFFIPKNPNGKLIIYHQGHGGDFSQGIQVIESLLKNNYSVIGFSMPLLGMNSQPIIDHSQFGKIKINSHNHLRLLESKEFTPMKYFIHPVILTLNYIESNYNFDSIHMIGISGGGWTTTLVAALDDRINYSFSVAGSYPMFLRSESKNFGDYEQHNLELYQIANYLDLYVMASVGTDKKFIQIFNKYDPCCFNGTEFEVYENEITDVVKTFDEGYFKIYSDTSHKKHIISDYALEIIINELNSG